MVDRRVRSDLEQAERSGLVGREDIDIFRSDRDDAARGGDPLALRIADGVHVLADGDGIGVRGRDRRCGALLQHVAVIHFEHGDIVVHRPAHVRRFDHLVVAVQIYDDIVADVFDRFGAHAVFIIDDVIVRNDIGVPFRLIERIDDARARRIDGRLRGTPAAHCGFRKSALDTDDGGERRIDARGGVLPRVADLLKKFDEGTLVAVCDRLLVEAALIGGGRLLRGEKFLARACRAVADGDGGRRAVVRRRPERGTARERDCKNAGDEQSRACNDTPLSHSDTSLRCRTLRTVHNHYTTAAEPNT